MAPSSSPNPSIGMRLSELLQQPQEPFNLEIYLLEKGCSAGRRWIMGSQATPFCWPVNSAKRLPWKLSIHGVLRWGRAAYFLWRALAKLVYSKAIRKALQWNTNTPFNGSGTLSRCFHEDCKQQLTPVPVLELQLCDVSSASGNLNECLLLSPTMRESSIAFKQIQECDKKAEVSILRRLMLDCLREAEERIWGCNGCLSSQMFEEAISELILSWERQKGDVASLTQMVASDLSSCGEEWSQFKPETVQIGLYLEAAISDDLREEALLNML